MFFKSLQNFFSPKFQAFQNEMRVLFKSRIFLAMATIPSMYVIFRGFLFLRAKYNSSDAPSGTNQADLGYVKDHPVNKFVKPSVSYWERFRIYVASIIHDLLSDPTIEREGLNYLDKVFRHA